MREDEKTPLARRLRRDETQAEALGVASAIGRCSARSSAVSSLSVRTSSTSSASKRGW
jgi:hypothetical protein